MAKGFITLLLAAPLLAGGLQGPVKVVDKEGKVRDSLKDAIAILEPLGRRVEAPKRPLLRIRTTAPADHFDTRQFGLQDAGDQLPHHARAVDHQHTRCLGEQTTADIRTHSLAHPPDPWRSLPMNLRAHPLRPLPYK